MTTAVTIGIDVSSTHLDIAVWPSGPSWQTTYPSAADPALEALAATLAAHEPAVVALEATGGYEQPLVACLQTAA